MNWMVKRKEEEFRRLTPVEERRSHLQSIRNAPFCLSTAMFFVPCCLSLCEVVVGRESWGANFPKKKINKILKEFPNMHYPGSPGKKKPADKLQRWDAAVK